MNKDNWNPNMHEAPKDGTVFLAVAREGVYPVHWATEWADAARWRLSVVSWWNGSNEIDPIYWMPMQDLPAEKKS